MTMNPGVVTIVERCLHASHEGTQSFADTLVTLAGQDVESYRIDYREQRATHFHAGGSTHAVDLALGDAKVGDRFDAETIVQSIRASQRGELSWPAFVAATREAGCVGYVVWLTGRHVSYFGRRGEVHVERFPDALALRGASSTSTVFAAHERRKPTSLAEDGLSSWLSLSGQRG